MNERLPLPESSPLSVGQCASLACLLEATAPKPGNVHRSADFEDVSFVDFAASAIAIGPPMEHARERGVGATVLAAIAATRRVTDTNTNLGSVLLLAPLAAAPDGNSLDEGVSHVLNAMGPDDAELAYHAIRMAEPGGLGSVAEMDVRHAPPTDLLAAMRLAADRDLVARQYANGFQEVLQRIAPAIVAARQAGKSLTEAIIHTQLLQLSRWPDTLIARKCGRATAEQASQLAAAVLQAEATDEAAYNGALANFDFWLRADGHRRNPGATADLLCAGLFALLRQRQIQPPFR